MSAGGDASREPRALEGSARVERADADDLPPWHWTVDGGRAGSAYGFAYTQRAACRRARRALRRLGRLQRELLRGHLGAPEADS